MATADLIVATELRGVEQRAVVKELGDQLGSTHPGVAVWVGDQGSQTRDCQHLGDGVATQKSGLT